MLLNSHSFFLSFSHFSWSISIQYQEVTRIRDYLKYVISIKQHYTIQLNKRKSGICITSTDKVATFGVSTSFEFTIILCITQFIYQEVHGYTLHTHVIIESILNNNVQWRISIFYYYSWWIVYTAWWLYIHLAFRCLYWHKFCFYSVFNQPGWHQ